MVAEDWAEGMGASLRAGLRVARRLHRRRGDACRWSTCPIWCPRSWPGSLRRPRGPAALARASYDGMPGHPVLLGRDHWPGVLESARGDQGARAYLARREVVLVECGDLATGRDVDCPWLALSVVPWRVPNHRPTRAHK